MLGGKAQIDHAIDPRQEGIDVGGGELVGQELRSKAQGTVLQRFVVYSCSCCRTIGCCAALLQRQLLLKTFRRQVRSVRPEYGSRAAPPPVPKRWAPFWVCLGGSGCLGWSVLPLPMERMLFGDGNNVF